MLSQSTHWYHYTSCKTAPTITPVSPYYCALSNPLTGHRGAFRKVQRKVDALIMEKLRSARLSDNSTSDAHCSLCKVAATWQHCSRWQASRRGRRIEVKTDENRLPGNSSANAQYAFSECMVCPVVDFVTRDPRRLYIEGDGRISALVRLNNTHTTYLIRLVPVHASKRQLGSVPADSASPWCVHDVWVSKVFAALKAGAPVTKWSRSEQGD